MTGLMNLTTMTLPEFYIYIECLLLCPNAVGLGLLASVSLSNRCGYCIGQAL